MEEMLEDTMEGLEGDDDMEEEAEEEVDKVLYELTAGNVAFTLQFFLVGYTALQDYFSHYGLSGGAKASSLAFLHAIRLGFKPTQLRQRETKIKSAFLTMGCTVSALFFNLSKRIQTWCNVGLFLMSIYPNIYLLWSKMEPLRHFGRNILDKTWKLTCLLTLEF